MDKDLEKIKSLEVSRELTKRKLKKIFEQVEMQDALIHSNEEKIACLEKSLQKLFVKVDCLTDRLVKIEEETKELMKSSHIHKVTM